MVKKAAVRKRSPRGQGDRLKPVILDAAERLLVKTGSAETVLIRDVARAVGVTAPTIYRHFADKDELMTAVCERAFEAFNADILAELGDIEDPIARIRALAEGYVRFGLTNPGHFRVIWGDLRPFSHQPGNWDNVLNRTVNGFSLLMTECQRAVDRGLTSGDPMTLALNVWSLAHGMLSLRLVLPSLLWPSHSTQLDLFEQQIRTGKQAKAATNPRSRSKK